MGVKHPFWVRVGVGMLTFKVRRRSAINCCCLATLQPNSETQLGKPLLQFFFGTYCFCSSHCFSWDDNDWLIIGREGE